MSIHAVKENFTWGVEILVRDKTYLACYQNINLRRWNLYNSWRRLIYYCFSFDIFLFFSSPELRAQVSFSDHLSSASVHPSVCPSVCKLFTFSSSSPEPLGQFQPNLAQSILRWRGFKFVHMKGPVLFKGEIIREQRKYIDEIKKNLLLQNHLANFNHT